MKKLIRCMSKKLHEGDIAYSFTFKQNIMVESTQDYHSTIPEYSKRDVIFFVSGQKHIQRDNYFYKLRWESFKKYWKSMFP